MTNLMRRLHVLLGAAAATLVVALAPLAPASAQEFKQMELTDKLVTSFIAAQKDFAPLSAKLTEGGEKPDDALTKQLEDIAKKNGFQSFAEYEDVAANITIVLDGLDRASGTYTDPLEKMKKELEDIKTDATIPAEDKKLAIDDLSAQISSSQPLQYKQNIDVVKKHIAEIEQLIPEDIGESAAPEAKPSDTKAAPAP